LGYYHKSVLPFVGSEFMERASNHAIIIRADLQFRIRNNYFFIWKNNIGKSFDDFSQFREKSTNMAGMGITLGYSSPVGPVELTLMGSSGNKRPIIFINLGYWVR
jgi:NTE family protein